MATYSKHGLSTSPSGRPLSTSGLTQSVIHTVPLNTTDEVWIYATNITTTQGAVSIEVKEGLDFGTLAASYVDGTNTILLVPGIPITSGASTAIDIVLTDPGIGGSIFYFGYVNRITA